MSDAPDFLDVFPGRLKDVRESRGLTAQGLAEKTGLPPSSISHFEAGSRKPSFDNLRRLAGALDVTTDYLLGRVENADRVEGYQRLHRHFHKLSDRDVDLADDFLKMLADRNSSRHKK